MQGRSHSVKRLAVHLPFQQTVIFQEGKEQEALERAELKGTTLTAWFDLNSKCSDARQYLYSEIQYHYRYDISGAKWIVRQKNKDKVLSRMYAVSPKDMERYCLRLLLLHIPGACSFEDLRTINGTLCETFQEAAKLLNLLEDDTTWINAMKEATEYQMPVQLRVLFVTILFHGEPTSAKNLYSAFREAMMEDFRRNYDEDIAEQMCLRCIEEHLLPLGRDCKSYVLPATRNIDEYIHTNSESIDLERSKSARLISMFNQEQLNAFNTIMDSVRGNSTERCFFLNGPGGCGKTFVYQALISTLLGCQEIVKVVAPTGLASTLMKNGQTVHSGFGIPINLTENSVSKFVYRSKDAKLLRLTKLIIWDEISMCTATLLSAVDRSLRTLRNNLDEPFGGCTIVVGGDFRQQAPVVKHGNRVKVVEACLKSSRLWCNFKELPLKKNMRVDEQQVEFMEWLLEVGSGQNADNQQCEFLSLPTELICNDIIESVYGDNINALLVDEISSRSILCPKNEDTLRINETMLKKLNGNNRAFYSVDTVSNCESEEERAHYPTEFLNSITPMGMPPHCLNLKVGCCVMLLRNLSKLGLCNGTRLIVERLGDNIVDCTVFSGEQKGSRVFIPRICMDTNDSDMPFELPEAVQKQELPRRKQFPLRLAYSMTITKSQGQTFDRIGVFLPQPVFTHGQLYTALSRVKSKDGLVIQLIPGGRQGKIYENNENDYTVNCVYQELL